MINPSVDGPTHRRPKTVGAPAIAPHRLVTNRIGPLQFDRTSLSIVRGFVDASLSTGVNGTYACFRFLYAACACWRSQRALSDFYSSRLRCRLAVRNDTKGDRRHEKTKIYLRSGRSAARLYRSRAVRRRLRPRGGKDCGRSVLGSRYARCRISGHRSYAHPN